MRNAKIFRQICLYLLFQVEISSSRRKIVASYEQDFDPTCARPQPQDEGGFSEAWV